MGRHLGEAVLRIEDGTICGNATGSETVHQLLGDPLVGNYSNSLGIELFDHLERKLDEIRPSVFAGIVEYSIRGVLEDLIDKLVTKCLPNVGRSPE